MPRSNDVSNTLKAIRQMHDKVNKAAQQPITRTNCGYIANANNKKLSRNSQIKRKRHLLVDSTYNLRNKFPPILP